MKSAPGLGVVVGEGDGKGVGVFAEDGGEGLAVDFAGAFVIAGLEAGVVDGGVHDVGFHEDDGAVVEAVGEEVACPEKGVGGDGTDVVAARRVDVGGQFGNFREGGGDALPDDGFLFVGALEELLEHGDPLSRTWKWVRGMRVGLLGAPQPSALKWRQRTRSGLMVSLTSLARARISAVR